MREVRPPSFELAEPVSVVCQSLRKYFDGVRAIERVSLVARPGEIISVVGPSGCGKTTLLRLLAGFEEPDGGVVSLGDRVVAGPGAWVPPESRRVGMVFQDYALFPHLTVAQNVEFSLKRWDRGAREQRVRELMQMVHLEGMERRRPYQLSGGEQQRVALIRSLAPRPIALLLDEPFSSLDTRLRSEMREEVKAIVRDYGVTTIHVTHDQEEALFMGDRIGVMEEGRIEQVGTPEEVFHRPRTRFVARFMGVADFLPATVVQGGVTCEVGPLEGPTDFPAGARVDMLVRPDQVSLYPSQDGEGLVERRVFRGMDYMYSVTLPSGRTLRALQHHTVHHAVGDRVRVSISPGERIICFSPDGGY